MEYHCKRIGAGALAMLVGLATAAAQPPPVEDPFGKPDTPTARAPAAPDLDSLQISSSAFGTPGHGREDPPGTKRLAPDHDVWIDPKRKLVVANGYVCLRQGPLEMFACPAGTKEHESIVAMDCKAHQIHVALLAVGAKPGHPAVFDPKYAAAEGTEVKVHVLWRDADGKRHQMEAQQWIKDHATGKPLTHPWVFAGSGFWKDPEGRNIYLAEEGDLICVSNFTTATLDLPIKSSADAGRLVFVANTEKIPKHRTRVRLVLAPVIKEKPALAP